MLYLSVSLFCTQTYLVSYLSLPPFSLCLPSKKMTGQTKHQLYRLLIKETTVAYHFVTNRQNITWVCYVRLTIVLFQNNGILYVFFLHNINVKTISSVWKEITRPYTINWSRAKVSGLSVHAVEDIFAQKYFLKIYECVQEERSHLSR